MKSLFVTAALCAATVAHADFTGYYDPANWTIANDGDAEVLTSPTFITLTSPGDVPAGGYARFTIAAPAAGTVSFDWNFYSRDDPGFEAFGYLRNGLFTGVTSPTDTIQAGSTSFAVAAGDVFGFGAFAVDDQGGTATSFAFNFTAPVPEPASIALFGAGGLLVLALARRRRAD